MRALWSAASGMLAQQLNVDTIANNLANVDTTGFKKQRVDFQDLLYQTIQSAGTPTTAGSQLPVGIQVGLGVRPISIQKIFFRILSVIESSIVSLTKVETIVIKKLKELPYLRGMFKPKGKEVPYKDFEPF